MVWRLYTLLYTYWIEGWVGPELICTRQRKFLTVPHPELKPLGRPFHSQSLQICYPGSSGDLECVVRLFQSLVVMSYKLPIYPNPVSSD
jgi:hypothetical protein